MITILWCTAVAAAGGLFQVGTGPRPLQAPGSEILVGGGVRAGPSLGPVTPFVGATFLRASAKDKDIDSEGVAVHWSALGGVRFDFANLQQLAQPFLSAGGLYGASTGHIVGEGISEPLVWVDMGPGAFAGIGADAVIIPALRVGIEFGAAGARGTISYFEDGDKDKLTEQFKGTVIWSYADLHLTFRLGAAK